METGRSIPTPPARTQPLTELLRKCFCAELFMPTLRCETGLNRGNKLFGLSLTLCSSGVKHPSASAWSHISCSPPELDAEDPRWSRWSMEISCILSASCGSLPTDALLLPPRGSFDRRSTLVGVSFGLTAESNQSSETSVSEHSCQRRATKGHRQLSSLLPLGR